MQSEYNYAQTYLRYKHIARSLFSIILKVRLQDDVTIVIPTYVNRLNVLILNEDKEDMSSCDYFHINRKCIPSALCFGS